MRHTNIVNVLASAMNRAFIDVENEPVLQPVTEHQKAKIIEKNKNAILDDDARSDIRVNGFWTHNEQAFFDIRVFYPHAKSYENKNIEEVYKIHRNEKKSHYSQRILQVEHGSFTPFVCASTGSIDKEAMVALKLLASKIAEKTNEKYSNVICYLRCKLSFELYHSALMMLRGSRRRRAGPQWNRPVDVVINEAHIDSL